MKKMLCELEQQKVEQAQEIDSLEKMLMQFINQEEALRNLCGSRH